MKFAKTSAIALAVSAMLAGPVLAQGTSSDSKMRGGAQGKSQMQGAPSTIDDEELNAQPGAAGEKSAKTKGTVGSGAHKGTGGAAGDTATGKRQ